MTIRTNVKFIFSTPMKVRIDDVNWARHLDASKTASFLHTARLLFLKEHGLSEADCFGPGLILKSMFIDYKSQASFDDLLNIKISISEITNIKLCLFYEIENVSSSKILATAKADMVFFSYDKQVIANTPQEFIEYANRHGWI